jgi:hypothetical protein
MKCSRYGSKGNCRAHPVTGPPVHSLQRQQLITRIAVVAVNGKAKGEFTEEHKS